jgi:CHAT domain-containing protein
MVIRVWSVPDEATRELMEGLYRRRLTSAARADALPAAQQRKYFKAYRWSVFVCRGDPGPLAKPAP